MTRRTTPRPTILRTRVALRPLLLGGALAFLLLAGGAHADGGERTSEAPSETVFETIDGAALDALAALKSDRHPATRGRFRAGRILAVPGGYVWETARTASTDSRPVVRLSSGPDHVATYLARDSQPSDTPVRLRREQERRERDLVEKRDPRHRPLFVLTGKGRILVYRGDSPPETTSAVAVRN